MRWPICAAPPVPEDAQLFGQIGAGVTSLDTDDGPSLMHGREDGGIEHGQHRDHSPLAMEASSDLPSSASLCKPTAPRCDTGFRCRAALNGDVSFDPARSTFSPARRETDVGMFYRRGWLDGAVAAESFVEWRHEAPHASGEALVTAGLRLRLSLC